MNTHEEIYGTIDSINTQIEFIDDYCRSIMGHIVNKVRNKEGLIFTQYFDEFDKVYTSNDNMYENLTFEIKNDQFNLKYRIDFEEPYKYEEYNFASEKTLDITFTKDTTDINKILDNYKYVSDVTFQILKKLDNK